MLNGYLMTMGLDMIIDDIGPFLRFVLDLLEQIV